ncbi:MAG: DUF2892 domain-containing protein [Phycisphaerales bacterium]|nr:DUF2892 domain-containing protein [Phycisphaerales bacterium]
MKSNEGCADRAVRVVLGIVALVVSFMWLGVMDAEILGIVVAAVGVIFIVTGIAGFCPAYKIIGISTCKKSCCGCGTGSCQSKD